MISRGLGRTLLGAALLFLPAPALAASGQPKLAILVVGLDPAGQEEVANLSRLATTEVMRANRFDRISLADALDPASAQARTKKLAEAQEALKQGQKAYDDLDTPQSVKHFDRALKLFEQTDLSENYSSLIQAWTMKVASLVANGEMRAAHAELDRLLPLAPKAVLAPNFFPPDTIAYAEKVRRSLAGTSTAKLEVKASGIPALVFIDGKFAGAAPVRRGDLTQADHYVTVLADGYVLQQHRARSGLLEVEFKRSQYQDQLSAAADRVRTDPNGSGRDKAAREFGRQVGADQVLLLSLAKSTTGTRLETLGLRVEVKDGHNLAFRVATLEQGEALPKGEELLLAALLASDEPRGNGPVTHLASSGGGGSLRTTLGYVLLGTGAALAATGVYFGVSTLGIHNQIEKTPQVEDATALRQKGKSYALAADLSYLAALLVGGTGGYLAFFGGEKPSEPKGTVIAEPERRAESSAGFGAEEAQASAGRP